MSTNNYSVIYSEQIEKLCMSMVIKSQAVAEAINNDLLLNGYPVEEEMHLWKYFLNMSGEYHPTDTEMTITSLDNLQPIKFTKENLAIHKTTRKEYNLGGFYYEQLVASYPEQEDLIKGIINPVPIEKAIAAEDYSIMAWDSAMVEPQETNLISELDKFVKRFSFRYTVPGYNVTSPLYPAALLGLIYLQLRLRIRNIRVSNCHTERVHSYHLWNYLAGHSALDEFRAYLTFKQAHWLYRNIRYVEQNVGKKEVFDELVNILLTERGLNLYSFHIEHLVDEINRDNPMPKAGVFRTSINNDYSDTVASSVRKVLDLEETLAIWNADNKDDDIAEITRKIVRADNDEALTRVFESEAVDLSGSMPITLSTVLINQWLRWAAQGTYNTYITVPNPFTGNNMRMSVRDAVIVWYYLYFKANGRELESMPDVFCYRTARSSGYVTTDVFKILNREFVDDAVVRRIVDAMPSFEIYGNVEDFASGCQNIFDAVTLHRSIVGSTEHYKSVGEYKQAIEFCFQDYEASYEVSDVTAWLNEKGFLLQDLNAHDAEIVADNILAIATGQDANAGRSLRDLQAAMLNALSRLSSYDLQFIQTTNEINLKKTDWPTIRAGDVDMKTYSEVQRDVTITNPKTKAKTRTVPFTPKDLLFAPKGKVNKTKTVIRVDPTNKPTVATSHRTKMKAPGAPVTINSIEES